MVLVSKTETMGAMYVVWKMLKEKNYNVLLISKTLDQSSSNLLSVKDMLKIMNSYQITYSIR